MVIPERMVIGDVGNYRKKILTVVDIMTGGGNNHCRGKNGVNSNGGDDNGGCTYGDDSGGCNNGGSVNGGGNNISGNNCACNNGNS